MFEHFEMTQGAACYIGREIHCRITHPKLGTANQNLSDAFPLPWMRIWGMNCVSIVTTSAPAPGLDF